MAAVIVPKSDQINADDLIAGPRTITIASAKVTPGTEQPVSLGIVGDCKVFRPCKGMCRVMVQAWGADSQGFIGKSLTLYRDPDVTWGGAKVGGIRISHMSGIASPQVFAVSESRTKRKLMQVKPLAAEPKRPALQNISPASVEAPAADATVTSAGDGGALDGGFDLGEPEHVTAARGIEAALKSAEYPSDLEAVRRMKAEWSKVKRGDPTMFDTLARIAKQVEAEITGELKSEYTNPPMQT
jgi:hypothetical protein